MWTKTRETKVMRDPIHGYIHVTYQVIWDCINAKEMQRLRRIHQLGGVYEIYHTAEHSRFSHSLGVYEIIRRMTEEVTDIHQQLSEDQRVQVMCAGLLHDLGHGPFSHFFETLQDTNHEQRTVSLILDPATEVHQALAKEDPDLPNQVADILQNKHPQKMMHQMISSQLDADRMDYLLRDAYETGTSYGTFDLERILRTMRVADGSICMKESGMHSVEDYIMARYHMYWQVYLHADVQAYELLIDSFFHRYNDIKETLDLPVFSNLKRNMSNQEFLQWDEASVLYGFSQAQHCGDAILEEFAGRILHRGLFQWVENPDESTVSDIRRQLEEQGKPLAYYYHENRNTSPSYLPYQEDEQPIRICKPDGSVALLSQESEIVKALLRMETNRNFRIYYG